MATSAAANENVSRRARAEIRDIYAAALRAVEAAPAVKRAIEGLDAAGRLIVEGRRIHILGAGKAARHMAVGALGVLGESVCGGVIATPHTASPLEPLECWRGGHPLPDDDSVAAGEAMLRYAESVEAEDGVLFLISGGASAALELPIPGVSLEALERVTSHLLARGAEIQTLNRMRRSLSQLKAGGLLRRLPTDNVLTLAISDVIGDDPRMIGSGPTVPGEPGLEAALDTLAAYEAPADLVRQIASALAGRAEPGPIDRPPQFRLVATAADAAAAAASAARQLGFETTIEAGVTGEARGVGRRLGTALVSTRTTRGTCRIVSGETTVALRGEGRGGRNQELALAAALAMDGHPGIHVAAVGTDGVDGPTPAAGALADGQTVTRAALRGMDAHGYLAANDSYTFFAGLGDLVTTGPTGTNVMDLCIGLTTGTV